VPIDQVPPLVRHSMCSVSSPWVLSFFW